MRDEEFRLPIRTEVSISAELFVKASQYAANLTPPRSVEVLIEQLVIAALDAKSHKQVVFEWPPKRETRSAPRASEPNNPLTGEN